MNTPSSYPNKWKFKTKLWKSHWNCQLFSLPKFGAIISRFFNLQLLIIGRNHWNFELGFFQWEVVYEMNILCKVTKLDKLLYVFFYYGILQFIYKILIAELEKCLIKNLMKKNICNDLQNLATFANQLIV